MNDFKFKRVRWGKNHERCFRLLKSLLWVSAILFFSYTSLFVLLIQNGENFVTSYFGVMACKATILTNFGIVAFLVFDQLHNHHDKIKDLLGLVMASFIITFLLYIHADNVHNCNASNVIALFHKEPFGALLFIAYTCLVTTIRFVGVKPNDIEGTIETISIQQKL